MENIFEWGFLLSQSFNVFLLVFSQYVNGLLVEYKNVKVNYTRKINHFLLFLIPIFLNQDLIHSENIGLFILGAALAVFKFVFYIKPIRERVPFIKTMFNSFDRPEDRPHTLLWITSQTAVGYLVLIPMSLLFANNGLLELVLIPIFIYSIGDGLAEPVGVYFGKHAYRVHALFTKKKYTRTLEGSSVVFLTSIGVILFYHASFSPGQFIVALLTVPILMTLAEALSPHTWDSPTMFLVGYLTLFNIAYFV